jgi:peptidyl-dipeptidase Dcp
VLEHWLPTPEILNRYALHYQTGKPIPQALVEKIERADKFNQGFDTVEFLSSALIDMKLHLAGGGAIDPDKFERETLAALGMPSEIVMRHRTPQFMHVFGGDGYSAGYYSYLWSDTLTADAWEAFTEAGGPGTRPWPSGCATTCSRWATRSTRPTGTARSAAVMPASRADAQAWVPGAGAAPPPQREK